MTEFYPTIDTILWGRKTYDWALAYHRKKGGKGGMFDTKLANYVFSRKPPKRSTPGVEFVSEPVKAFAQRLRATPGKHIWMMGGGGLIASFLDAGEIDEFDIHVIAAVDDLLRHPDDQPSIGLIICKTKDQVVAEYALRNSTTLIGISEYKLAESLTPTLKGSLPTIEELEDALGRVSDEE